MYMEKINEDKILELKKEFREMHNSGTCPAFDTDKYFDIYKEYPLFVFSDRKTYDDEIDISDIVGSNWAFESPNIRGNYPRYHKVNDILDYYRGILKHSNDDIPRVPIEKIMGKYSLDEGNHRLYALKLLVDKGLIKNPKIKATVTEFDYKTFLRGLRFRINEYKDFKMISAILEDNRMYDLSEAEYIKLVNLKEELDKKAD